MTGERTVTVWMKRNAKSLDEFVPRQCRAMTLFTASSSTSTSFVLEHSSPSTCIISALGYDASLSVPLDDQSVPTTSLPKEKWQVRPGDYVTTTPQAAETASVTTKEMLQLAKAEGTVAVQAVTRTEPPACLKGSKTGYAKFIDAVAVRGA